MQPQMFAPTIFLFMCEFNRFYDLRRFCIVIWKLPMFWSRRMVSWSWLTSVWLVHLVLVKVVKWIAIQIVWLHYGIDLQVNVCGHSMRGMSDTEKLISFLFHRCNQNCYWVTVTMDHRLICGVLDALWLKCGRDRQLCKGIPNNSKSFSYHSSAALSHQK